ncbi:hypothetical protein AA103196_2073 [Ameyamaea chiangmaiensis NBRC 103196]|uniref:Anti-sigma factor NepR domain-containing protein n=1 Tax=Ameyamaea chiangmaiensis TaxID=442969 RepID=A0A850PDG3_9PROT|nr:NepR family anti-sigma factor [Ameyamaea chiangmaiensis]MBS4073661.1 hypothetical protein [Ameyamaea chiangmaiensis]NVN39071.1 hypothetical protein [Ameyamaea chiangmaiensis]GBQ68902.1 hypothetical protein AA103196_2073 [Ameyamaea chiangmaiensis NBRC 103196]
MAKSERSGGRGVPEKGTTEREQEKGDEADGAFDLWLKRGLHQLFDSVANEPIPDELLRLIEEDRES